MLGQGSKHWQAVDKSLKHDARGRVNLANWGADVVVIRMLRARWPMFLLAPPILAIPFVGIVLASIRDSQRHGLRLGNDRHGRRLPASPFR